MSRARDLSNNAQGSAPQIIGAKGDLLVGTADNVVTNLAVGANGTVLTAASGQATGLQWTTISAVPASGSATVDAAETTSSTSYTNLTTAGPAVTLTTGTKALVIIGAQVENSGTNCRTSFEVSGATTIAASDTNAMYKEIPGYTLVYTTRVFLVTLTAGSNTFTMKYRSSGNSTWDKRSITVINLA